MAARSGRRLHALGNLGNRPAAAKEVKGYPGWFAFGNPGPPQGRRTRYRATSKLLAICAEHGITTQNVSEHFWIEFEMPSELVQLTSLPRSF
jgi:hypothetical protein